MSAEGSTNLKELMDELGLESELEPCIKDAIERYEGLGFPFMKAVEMTLRLLIFGGIHIHERISLQKD